MNKMDFSEYLDKVTLGDVYNEMRGFMSYWKDRALTKSVIKGRRDDDANDSDINTERDSILPVSIDYLSLLQDIIEGAAEYENEDDDGSDTESIFSIVSTGSNNDAAPSTLDDISDEDSDDEILSIVDEMSSDDDTDSLASIIMGGADDEPPAASKAFIHNPNELHEVPVVDEPEEDDRHPIEPIIEAAMTVEDKLDEGNIDRDIIERQHMLGIYNL